MAKETLILDKNQIQQRINRIAYQILEDNSKEKELIFAGITKTGYSFAKKLEKAFSAISEIKVVLCEVHFDKSKPIQNSINVSLEKGQLKGKVIILIDDVLNTGKTLTYALKALLEADIKKIRTVLLVDRDHKNYPINADFVGHTLSTTLQEHIRVDMTRGSEAVYLS
ncbi:MAG TPA: phosphoribosyltransferase family protein [Bacteroidia bacterium]|nr:phosphoribosyltransferase family protein [Bacteroidia bacterium]HNT79156.1 phosphoribosyltransferase family protein [Bacteroidia bacterium]